MLHVNFQGLITSLAVGSDVLIERTGAWKQFLRDFVLVYFISTNVDKFVGMKILGPLHYSSCKELPNIFLFFMKSFFFF